MAKRNYTIRSEINLEINTTRFWVEDLTREPSQPLPGYSHRFYGNKFDPKIAEYPENTRMAILVGVTDSGKDAAALGKDATLKAKWESLVERLDYIESGCLNGGWMNRGSVSGRVSSENALLLRAIAIVYADQMKKLGLEASDILDTMKEDAKKKAAKWETYREALFKSKRLGPTIEKLRDEEAAKLDIDADELLADLGLEDSDSEEDEEEATEE